MQRFLEKIKKEYSLEDYTKLEKICNEIKDASGSNFNDYFNTSLSIYNLIEPLNLDIDSIIVSVILPFDFDDEKVKQLLNENDEALSLYFSIKKLSNINYADDTTEVENLREMFVAIAKDIRVIIIKLASVLVSAENLKDKNSEFANKLHYEIKEIYAPLAARLGLSFIKTKLYDLNMAFYNPIEYENLTKQLNEDVDKRQETISKVKIQLEKSLEELKIKGSVNGRIKSCYSIYNKLKAKNCNINQIYDIVALRVMVNTVNECYAILGAIHTKYDLLDGRFKDYIAKPKPNGYQSLHTCVVVDDMPLEIQIRTYDMHNHAEYGIAAHWLYKEHKNKTSSLDEKLVWIRKIIENNEITTASDFLDNLKTDVYSDEIFVQSPQGKIVHLVENSTPIDFAYMIHSEIGNKCVGAKINGKMQPLSTPLNNGDVVEIITSTNSKGPSRDWLKICKTSQAKSKINAFFKKEMKTENIKKGKSILEQACKVKNVSFHDLFQDKYLFSVYEKYSLKNLDEIFATVGYGSLNSNQIINRLYSSYKLDHGEPDKKLPIVATKSESSTSAIRGLSDVMIKFARCCNPIPGDDIVGYISRGNGLTIHKCDCASLSQFEQDRIMKLEWNKDAQDESYNAGIQILVANTSGVLAEITNKISEKKININYINTENAKDGNVIINVGVNIKNKQELIELCKKIENMPNVLSIVRGANK